MFVAACLARMVPLRRPAAASAVWPLAAGALAVLAAALAPLRPRSAWPASTPRPAGPRIALIQGSIDTQMKTTIRR